MVLLNPIYHKMPLSALYSVDDTIINTCGAVSRIRMGRGKKVVGESADPVTFCPPQVPNVVICDRIRAAAVKKKKLSLKQAMKAHTGVRGRGSHIFQTIGSQMAVRLSVLRAGGALPP
jgi:hypothetical protein